MKNTRKESIHQERKHKHKHWKTDDFDEGGKSIIRINRMRLECDIEAGKCGNDVSQNAMDQ